MTQNKLTSIDQIGTKCPKCNSKDCVIPSVKYEYGFLWLFKEYYCTVHTCSICKFAYTEFPRNTGPLKEGKEKGQSGAFSKLYRKGYPNTLRPNPPEPPKSKNLDSNYLEKVSEFHKAFQAPIENNPIIPNIQRCELRYNLIQEELNEFKKAMEDKDLVAIADSLGDLQVVLSGSIIEFGMQNKFKEIFDEIHRSNMSKSCKNEKEAIETVEYYKINKNTEAYYKEINGIWLVFRKGDNKVLKSINYSPAKLEDKI